MVKWLEGVAERSRGLDIRWNVGARAQSRAVASHPAPLLKENGERVKW